MQASIGSLMFGVILVLIHSQVQGQDGVELFIPPDLGTVKFGDPVFLPVTIVNRSNEEAVVPSLYGANPQMTIEAQVIAPNSVAFETMGEGGAHLHTTSLPARHSIRFVFAVILWHPSTVAYLSDDPELRIKVYSTKDEEQSRWSLSGDLSDSSRVAVSGSAVVNLNEYILLGEQMVDVMKDNTTITVPITTEFPKRLEHSYSILDFLYHGVTAWPKWQEDVLHDIPSVSRLSQTREYLTIRERVVQGTALFRAMRCAEIREFIERGEEPLEERLAKGLKDFREVLSEARPAEYEFHVLSLRHVPTNAMPDARAKCREAFREAFPEILAGKTDREFLPVVPLPY